MSKSGTPGVNIRPDVIINNSIAMVILATIFVSLRVYVRAIMIKSFGYDDWILLAAYISFIVLSSLSLAYGSLVKANGLEPVIDQATLILVFRSFFYSVDMTMVKLALAAFYFKVLPRDTWQRHVVVIATGLFTLYTITLGFVFLFQCGNPMDIESTNCLPDAPLLATSWTQASLNAFMDWLLTLLPVTIIFKAQMSKRTKISVIALLGLGVLASVISVARMPLLHTGDVTGLDTYVRVTTLLVVSNWENCIGLMAISLAALRPLLRKITKGSTYATAQYPTGNTKHSSMKQYNKSRTQKSQIEVQTTFQVQAESSQEEIELMRRSEETKYTVDVAKEQVRRDMV
ncbi:hypothetical protein KVT40_005409 [Elsinoe batatas]|uniref:Rhodopsin domain-containing protein n=1 Tax=Elsinoe batatas TaxID=2601811 RepID=A0A8K0KYR6_9PEZI|nr:hypothetical protein KVT40_005409 [Elsinoe batatas]